MLYGVLRRTRHDSSWLSTRAAPVFIIVCHSLAPDAANLTRSSVKSCLRLTSAPRREDEEVAPTVLAYVQPHTEALPKLNTAGPFVASNSLYQG